MIETETLPPGWAGACRPLTELWVPSSFNAAVFAAAGLDESRIRVIPIGVDTDLFRPRDPGGPRPELPRPALLQPPGYRATRRGAGRARPGRAGTRSRRLTRPSSRALDHRFRFLSVFAWQERKGWDILLRAYLREFSARDDVVLVLKTLTFVHSAREIHSDWTRLVAGESTLRRYPPPAVEVLTGEMSPWEMARLYAACDAFVLPSRGEGLGRPYLEAMACGLPAIGTRWGGNLDFMNDGNSYLVDVERLEAVPANTKPGLLGGQRWARPSLEHLRVLMRRVYENREEARERGNRAKADVAAGWNIEVTCGRLARELDKWLPAGGKPGGGTPGGYTRGPGLPHLAM